MTELMPRISRVREWLSSANGSLVVCYIRSYLKGLYLMKGQCRGVNVARCEDRPVAAGAVPLRASGWKQFAYGATTVFSLPERGMTWLNNVRTRHFCASKSGIVARQIT